MKAIKTTYFGPTNTRGSRIKATDGDGNSASIPYPYELNQDDAHKLATKKLCEKMGWPTEMIMGSFPDCNVHVFKPGDEK